MFKKVMLLAALAVSSISFGQIVDGKKISELNAPFIQAVGTTKLMKPFQVTLYLDFGQISKVSETKKGHVYNESTGKLMSFNGMMDVMNMMDKNGYEYVDAYTVSTQGASVYHYIYRKKEPNFSVASN